jgi:zinc D-Ala-D-Ala dipeptidase
MSDMLLLSDPAVAAIPVRECHEALVDVRSALRVDPRLADPAGAYARLRVGVLDRLVTAQTVLPPDLRLLVVEGYRPLALQVRYFRAHLDRLRARWPDADASTLHRMTSRYISPPEVAPHVAGAAVDLTLCTVDGSELWLGTEVNDTDTTACHTDAAGIAADARARRLVLAGAMGFAGFINYPSEWWHWSYGDRYWACRAGADHARYGPIEA